MTRNALRSVLSLCFGSWCLFGSGCLFDLDRDGDEAEVMPLPDDEPDPAEPLEEEEPFQGPCVPDAWHDAAADASVGMDATFSLWGDQLRVFSDNDPHVEAALAPFVFDVALDEAHMGFMAFDDAQVDGQDSGTVIVIGERIDAVSGSLLGLGSTGAFFEDTHIRLSPGASVDDGTRPDLGPEADPQHVAALAASQRLDVDVHAVQLEGYDAAYLVRDGEVVPLTNGFEISASGLFWSDGSALDVQTMTARYDGGMRIGINSSDGTFTPQMGERVGEKRPVLIDGADAYVEVGPGEIHTLEPMHVRLAMSDEGPVLPSSVEIRACVSNRLVLHTDQVRKLRFAFREHAGVDAVFADFTVQTEDGEPLAARIELTGSTPDWITQTAEGHSQYLWGQAIVRFIEAWVSFTEAWVEAVTTIVKGVTCVFTFGLICDTGSGSSEPDSLLPYWAWIEPNRFGEFEVELKAPSMPGTYDVTITVLGQNYRDEVPLTLVVR